jgi:AcrR family transcriptional regulator
MSRIAERTGIGRATLYKYFPDVEAILLAWHGRQIGQHLAELEAVRDAAPDAIQGLSAVLEAYAVIVHEHPQPAFSGALHRGGHVGQAQQHLRQLVAALIAEAAKAGQVRDDVGAEELAGYSLAALAAAADLPSKPAVRRLVAVTLAGLHAERVQAVSSRPAP